MVIDNSRNVPQQIASEDWFSRGKTDALKGYSKQPPETDPEQASQYDLGYGEGSIQRSLAQIATPVNTGDAEVKDTFLDRTFRDDEGKIVIAQMPNLPLLTGVIATFLQFILPNGQLHTAFELLAFGALFTWSWQELFAGVNYFRRSLGFIVLASLIVLGANLSQM
jgi:hypothetical protein